MNREELTQFNICPFNMGALSDGIDGEETEREEKAHFVLLLRYLALFVKQCQLPFSIPHLSMTLERKNIYSFRDFTFQVTKTTMMKQLCEEIMLKSGWSYGICALKNGKTGTPELHLLDKDSIMDWEQALFLMPGLFTLEKRDYHSLRLIVCWNRRVARYRRFAMDNPEKIAEVFQAHDSLITHILREMADPFATGELYCHEGRELYTMGLFEGTDGDFTISLKDMDYNFFIQAMVLHMLLESAEALFGYPDGI